MLTWSLYVVELFPRTSYGKRQLGIVFVDTEYGVIFTNEVIVEIRVLFLLILINEEDSNEIVIFAFNE